MPELQQKFLDTAYRRTMEIDQLLERLFFYLKMETGNMPIDLQRLEWNDFLQKYVDNVNAKLEGENVICRFAGAGAQIYSMIDTTELEANPWIKLEV